MEATNESNRDSFKLTSNSKGYGFEIKVYVGGDGTLDDSEDKVKLRLDRYVQHFNSKYGNSSVAPF